MSRIAVANCPLSDCTLAVDNAENIRHCNDKLAQGLKLTFTDAIIAPSPRKCLRGATSTSHNIAITEKSPSVRRERVLTGSRRVNAHTIAVAGEPSALLEAHRPSALDVHIFAKPFTPASMPHRNDPYAPCLLNSPCTPEDSFYACYCDVTDSRETTPEETSSVLHTPVRPSTAGVKPTLGETTRNLLEMFSLVSTPSKSPSRVTPVRPTEAVSASASPERAASTPPLPPTTSSRVVRKVVGCNVDRTSGRPVPKPRTA